MCKHNTESSFELVPLYVWMIYSSVLSWLKKLNIPLKVLRYKDWTKFEWKSTQCPKKTPASSASLEDYSRSMKKQQPYNKFWLLGGKYKEVSGGFTVYIQEYIFAELL